MEPYAMTTATPPPITCDRLEARVDKLEASIDAMRERQAETEKEMIGITGSINLLRAETASRDGEHTAAIRAMRKDMGATQERLDAFSTEISQDISGGFASIETTLSDLKLKDAIRSDREKRNTGPVPASAVASAVAGAPTSAVISADSDKLKAARGWVDLVKSIPPLWILILILGCIGGGAVVTVLLVAKLAGWF
jgi:chromosome segregation ATPase